MKMRAETVADMVDMLEDTHSVISLVTWTLLMHGKHEENLPTDVLEGIIHVLKTTAGGIDGVLPRG